MDDISRKIKRRPEDTQGLHRKFKNLDNESCWINSCLQLILTAMDHEQDLTQDGSPLWEHLIWLKKKENSESLDPIPIRNIILAKEKERIIKHNIAPDNRLFDLGQQEVFQEKNLLVNQDMQRIGQQDCKDFFICLAENETQWTDVYNSFKVNSTSFTTCSSCKNVSLSRSTENLFFLYECPEENVSMSYFIDRKLNCMEIVKEWKDEDGCKKTTDGKYSTRIKDITKTKFLIFVLNRLIRVDGLLQILTARVPVGGNVLLHDISGKSTTFSPIAVIHHAGEVIQNTTRGHYQADVLQKTTNKWFRTSDDEAPIEIEQRDLTEKGYIFLYKKTS